MSEEDRLKLLALREKASPETARVVTNELKRNGIDIDAPQRRPMTEAEERLLEAAMLNAEKLQYHNDSDFDRAQIAVLEERTSYEARERFRQAYIAQNEAGLVRYRAQKGIPALIVKRIVDEVDKLFEPRWKD